MLTRPHGRPATCCGRSGLVALSSGTALYLALATTVFGAQPQVVAGDSVPALKGEQPKPEQTQENVVVHCEVWNVVDPALLKRAESAAEADPIDASAIREQLMVAPAGARRLARLLAPMPVNNMSLFQDSQEGAAVQPAQKNGSQDKSPAPPVLGTTLNIRCLAYGENQLETTFRLKIVGMFGIAGEKEMQSESVLRTVTFEFVHLADSGVFRMYQGSSSQPGTVIVFLKVTRQ